MPSGKSSKGLKQKRTRRGPYLDGHEKALLLSLAKSYEEIILVPKLSRATNLAKNVIWQQISKDFNKIRHPSKKRTAEQLKNIYRSTRYSMKRVRTLKAAECKEQHDIAETSPITSCDTYSCDNVDLISSDEECFEGSLEEEPTATKSEELSISETSLLEPMTYGRASTTSKLAPQIRTIIHKENHSATKTHNELISAAQKFGIVPSDNGNCMQLLAEKMPEIRTNIQVHHKENHSATKPHNEHVSSDQLLGIVPSDNGNCSQFEKDRMSQTGETNRPETTSNESEHSLTSKEMKSIMFHEYIAIGKLKQKLLASKIKYFEEKTRLLSEPKCNKKL